MEKLYSEIYDLLAESKIYECNLYIENFLKTEQPLLLQVAIARITKPFKSQLPNRKILLVNLKENLNKECSALEAESVYSHVS